MNSLFQDSLRFAPVHQDRLGAEHLGTSVRTVVPPCATRKSEKDATADWP